MTDQIRWGILSTANIGKVRVIPAIMQSRNGVVAAVASRDLEKAKAFAHDLNIPTSYGSYEELIADPNIDAIYNPLPNSEHAVWSIRCAEAGKAVLCEKPLASNADEAQHMVDAFTTRSILFTEAFMYRFHPQTQKVKALVQDGAVGTVHFINATFSFTVRSEANIRLSKTLAGGALMDVGCYCVNVMRFLTDEEPTQARALAQFGEVDERLVGILEFPSGVLGHFDCSLRSHLTHLYEVRGSKGRIFVREAFALNSTEPTKIRLWHDNDYEDFTIPVTNHYQLMVEDFADALLHKRPPRFAPADGVANMRVIDRLLASL